MLKARMKYELFLSEMMSKFFSVLKIATVLFLFFGFELVAQPFSHIDIGVNLSSPSLQDKSYSDRWILTNGYSVQIRSPYYKRLIIGGEITFFSYEKRASSYSNVESINYSFQLGVNLINQSIFALFMGADIGIQKTNLTQRGFTSNTDERELYYSLFVEPNIVLNNIVVFGTIKYQKVFNFQRQHILYTGIGVKLRLKLSTRTQNFIR